MNLRIGSRAVHYDLLGPPAAPVVYFAHSLSSDSGIWSEQLPTLLAQGWRVLRVDMRGHGGSDPVAGDYTMVELADDVLLTLDLLRIEKIHFVGVSIGGMIGQTLGIRHRRRLHSLTLCDTSPKAVPGGKSMWEARFSAIRAAGSVEPLADDTMRRWFTDAYRNRRPDQWLQVRETVAATTPEGYRGGATAIINFDVLSDLHMVSTPTLVICGDEDSGTPPEDNRTIARLIPGARYQEITPARHLPMLEHADTFNRLLLDWLGEQREATPP